MHAPRARLSRAVKHIIEMYDVTDELYQKLAARAESEGKSLSEYLLDQLWLIVEQPTTEEMRARLAMLEPVFPIEEP